MSSTTVRVAAPPDRGLTDERFSARVILTILLCLLATSTEGYDFQSMSLAAPLLARAWRLHAGIVGLLLTASVAGVVAGSLLLAPLGDRYGRRPCILAGLLAAAVFTAAGAFAPSVAPLLVVRVLAGLGIGLATPNINATAMEVAPTRWRALAIVLVSCGYPLGAGFGAAAASGLVRTYGAQAIFLLGAAATGVILIALLAGLPESPQFLARSASGRASRDDGISSPQGRSKIAALFTPERRMTTLLLWLLSFLSFVTLYFFLSWLPSLLAGKGLNPSAATRAVAVFNAGGVAGALVFAVSLRRLPPAGVLAFTYALAGFAVLVLAAASQVGGSFTAAVALAGAAVIGSQFCLTAVVNQFYPTPIRVSAGGYAAGMGRLGAVVSPMVGALAVTLVGSASQVFLITAVPSLVAFIAALWLLISRGLQKGAISS